MNVNMMTVVHQGSSGMVTGFPDVCKTPSPAGPIPIPYPNIAMSSDTSQDQPSAVLNAAGLNEAVGADRNHALPYRLVTSAWNCHSVAELFRSRRRSMVKRKTPSPKAKKVIVKHMVKDAKKLRTAYAKGKKKKFQAAFGRLSAAMIDIDPKGGK